MSGPLGSNSLESPLHMPPADVLIGHYDQAYQVISSFALKGGDHNDWPTDREGLDASMLGIRGALYTVMLAKGALTTPVGSGNWLQYARIIDLDAGDPIRTRDAEPGGPESEAMLTINHALSQGVMSLGIKTGPEPDSPRYGMKLNTGYTPRGTNRGLSLGESALMVHRDGGMSEFDPVEAASMAGFRGFYIITRCFLRYFRRELERQPPISLKTLETRNIEDPDVPRR